LEGRVTRKVIQVVSDPRALIVLCDDGTIWHEVGEGWKQIPGPDGEAEEASRFIELIEPRMLRDGFYLFQWKRGDFSLCLLKDGVINYTDLDHSYEAIPLDAITKYRFLGETLS
jgi:hypothetical protein